MSNASTVGSSSVEVTLSPTLGIDFWDDMKYVQDRTNTEFRGDPYYSSQQGSAPNPGLSIDGLDSIGIPVGSREARTIIGYSSANLGGCNNASNRWSIKSDQVKFNNPAWTGFLKTSVEKACDNLGVASWHGSIKCHFSELILLNAGEKAALPIQGGSQTRRFATFMIVLPSWATGGKLRLTHDSKTADFHLEEGSFTTNIFAWYDEVESCFSAVKSGCYLVLVYQMIHAEGSPSPKVPSVCYIQRALEHVMHTWHHRGYSKSPSRKQVTFLLSKQYPQDCRQARWRLEQRDQNMITIWENCVEALGYSLFIGELKYHKYTRVSDTLSGNPTAKPKVSVKDIYELGGTALNGAEICLIDDSVIPSSPFLDQVANWINRNKETGLVDQCFTGTAILVVSAEETLPVLQSAGVAYSLGKLGKLRSAPVGKDKMNFKLLLNRICESTDAERDAIMSLCLSWKDINCWEKVIEESGTLVGFFEPQSIVKACRTFSFKAIQHMLEKMMKGKTSEMKPLIDLVEELYKCRDSLEPSSEIEAWCMGQYKTIIANHASLALSAVPELQRIVVTTNNASLLIAGLLPKIRASSETSSLELIHSIVTGLRSEMANNLPSHFQNFTKECARFLSNHLKIQVFGSSEFNAAYALTSSLISRVAKMLEICVLSEDLAMCTPALCLLLRFAEECNHWDSSKICHMIVKLQDKGLKQAVERTNTKLSGPLKAFFRSIIAIYFRLVFAKTRPDPIGIGDFGCSKDSCKSCNQVRQFLQNPSRSYMVAGITSAGYKHLQRFMEQLSQSITYTRQHRKPFNLTVQKQSRLVEWQAWETNVQNAKKLLKIIGTDNELKTIMGDLYPNVINTLAGLQKFEAAEDFHLIFGKMGDNLEITPLTPTSPQHGVVEDDSESTTTGTKRSNVEIQESTPAAKKQRVASITV